MERFTFSRAPVKRVDSVQFGTLSPDEITRTSVALIDESSAYEGGKPKVGGLADPRLGTVDRNILCDTCNSNFQECPGHFGHHELALPVFHLGFQTSVLKILRSVCFSCSRIMCDRTDPAYLKVNHHHRRRPPFLSPTRRSSSHPIPLRSRLSSRLFRSA